MQLGGWRIGEAGDRERDNVFTARIHDPPIGGGRTVKVVMKQWARLHNDGTFSVDIHNVRCPPSMHLRGLTQGFMLHMHQCSICAIQCSC